MAKKRIKKKKLRIFRLMIIILVIVIIFFAVDLFLNTKVKNIIIKGTTYLKDDYIIDLANLKDYPSYYYKMSWQIEKMLKKSPYIKDIKVRRKFYHIIELDVKEEKPVFISVTNNTLVLENKKEIPIDDENFRIPRLMNYVPNTKYSTLIKDILKIDSDIYGKVSEITYVPNEFDKDRFLLYMDDGNTVYLTLTKFKMLNYYNDVLEQLSSKKGILYLDSGNHFKIKE